MNKKKICFNVLKFIPFIIGCILFIGGCINLFSSLLLFVGGYVVLKNLCDYRIFRKNINYIYDCKKGDICVNKQNKDNVDDNIIALCDDIKHNYDYSMKQIKVRKRIK